MLGGQEVFRHDQYLGTAKDLSSPQKCSSEVAFFRTGSWKVNFILTNTMSFC